MDRYAAGTPGTCLGHAADPRGLRGQKALATWADNYPSAKEYWEVIRQEISILYTRFYAAVFFGIVLIYQLQDHFPVVLMLALSFWVPQIALNAKQGSTLVFSLEYIRWSSMLRLVFPCYIYGCVAAAVGSRAVARTTFA